MIGLKDKNVLLELAYEDEIEQEGNGKYQLSFKYPISDERWKSISNGDLVLADDLHGEQEFRIFEIVKRNGYLFVYANQVFDDLNSYSINAISVSRVAGQTVMQALAGSVIRSHSFSFFSDIDSRHTFNRKNVSVMTALADGKHSIIGQWGGDLVRDKYQVKLLKNGGRESEALFMFKKNLKTYVETISSKDLVTRLHLSLAESDVKVTVDSPLIGSYGGRIFERNIEVQNQDIQTVDQLRQYGQDYFVKNLVDIPSNSLSIAVVDNHEYDVRLFDTVFVHHEVFGKDLRMKISSYKFAPMSKKLKSIGFGKIQTSLGDKMTSIANEVSEQHQSVLEADLEAKLQKEIDNANRHFDAEFNKRVEGINDSIEQVKAKSEEFQAGLRSAIDEKIATSRKEPYDLAQSAKRIAEEAKQDLASASERLLAQVNQVNTRTGNVEQSVTRLQSTLQEQRRNLSEQLDQTTVKTRTLEENIGQLRSKTEEQARLLTEQARNQQDTTSRVTTVEETLEGTRTNVSELTRTVNQATGDLAGVSRRTKTVEDDLSQTRRQYEALSQTVNTQTGQMGNISRRTGTIEAGLAGVQEKFENLSIGGRNYLPDYSFSKRHTFTNHQSVWSYERLADPTSRSGYLVKATCIQAGGAGFHYPLLDLRGAEWQGRTMTFAVDVKSSKAVSMRVGPEVFKNYTTQTYDVTTDWKRLVSTRTVEFRQYWSFIFYSTGTQWQVGDVLYIRDPQLEDGSVATSPHASEEEFRSEIASYKRTAEESSATLSRQIQTVEGKTTEVKTFAQQTAERLATRLESLESFKNGEGARASQYFSASRDETARQLSALRTAITDGYVAKATHEEDVRGIQRRFESLQVGGRNLYALSRNKNIHVAYGKNFNMDIQSGTISVQTTGADMWIGNVSNPPGTYNDGYGIKIPIIQGREVIVHITNPLFTKNYVSFFDSDSRTLKNFQHYRSNKFSIPPSVLEGVSYITIRYGVGASNVPIGTVIETKVKVEFGTIPTDWSPAPEDIDGQLELLRSNLATYSQTNSQNLAELTQRIEQTNGTIVQAKTRFEQTAQSLQTDLSAVQSYVSRDGTRTQAMQEYVRTETATKTNALRTEIGQGYVSNSRLTETVSGLERRFESLSTSLNTRIATYAQGVDGNLASLRSQIGERVTTSVFNQKLNEIKQSVTDLNGAALKHSEVSITAQGVTLGAGKTIGATTISSILTTSPDSIQAITDKMVITANNENLVKVEFRSKRVSFDKDTSVSVEFPPVEPFEFLVKAKVLSTGSANRFRFFPKIKYEDGTTAWVTMSSNPYVEKAGAYSHQCRFTLPTSSKKIRCIYFVIDRHGTPQLEDIQIYQKSSAELIVDGSITGRHIMAGTIEGGNIKGGTITGHLIAADAIVATHIKADNAFFEKLAAGDILANKLFTKELFATKVQAVTISASMVKSGILTATNGAMNINLNTGQILYYTDQAAMKRVLDGYPTQFVKFATGKVDGKGNVGVTVIGSNRSGTESTNDGYFVGIRAWNGPETDILDLVGDTIRLASSTYNSPDGWDVTTLPNKLNIDAHNASDRPSSCLSVGDIKLYRTATNYTSLMTVLQQFNHNFKHLVNITGRGDVILTWETIK